MIHNLILLQAGGGSSGFGFWKFIILLLVIYVIYQLFKSPSEVVGNWNYLFEDLQFDPQEFYHSVKEILEEKEVPQFGTGTKNIKEGGLLSYHRQYFVVYRGDYVFHICAAPWGKGFFFSWWARVSLSSLDGLLGKIPFIGKAIVERRQYKAYYKIDTDIMFRTSVHQSVLQAIDRLTEAKGIRGLTELERRPDFRAVFK